MKPEKLYSLILYRFISKFHWTPKEVKDMYIPEAMEVLDGMEEEYKENKKAMKQGKVKGRRR